MPLGLWAATIALSARSENVLHAVSRYDEDKAGMSQAFGMGVLQTKPPVQGLGS